MAFGSSKVEGHDAGTDPHVPPYVAPGGVRHGSDSTDFRLSCDRSRTRRTTAGSKRRPVRVRTVVHQRRSHNLGRLGRCPHESWAPGQQGALDSAPGNATESLGATPRLTRAAGEGRNSLLLSYRVPSQWSLLPDRGLLGDFGQGGQERTDFRHAGGTEASRSVREIRSE